MIFLIVLTAMVVLPFVWVVFVPVYIEVNTDNNLYQISQAGTVRISFHPAGHPLVTMYMLGFKVNTNQKRSSESVKAVRKQRKRPFKRSLNSVMYLLKGIARGFHCKRFICSLDLDDVIWNAQLVPVFHFINSGPVQLSINFRKRYYLDMLIQVRINQLVWTFIRFFLTKK